MQRRIILAASAVGIGGVGGITVLSVSYLIPKDKSIKGFLKSKGIRLISSDLSVNLQDDQWAAEYKTSESEIKKLIGYTPSQDSNNVREGGWRLKRWCDSVMDKDASLNKEDLDNAQKYCGIKSIQQQLQRLGAKVFEEGDSGWEQVYNKRKSESRSSVTFEEWKKECFKTRTQDFIATSMSTRYSEVLMGCTDKGLIEGINTALIEINNMLGEQKR